MPPQILPLLGSASSGGSSAASSKMQSRDHPFNQSSRPLLERRAQPQVVSSKKATAAPPGPAGHPGPKVPTRGYNDFNLISRQYETWNSTHSHQGYPYGSPPSPTHDGQRTDDFQFSDIVDGPQRAELHQRTVHQYTVNSNNRDADDDDDDDDDDYDELVYHHNQLNSGAGGGGGAAAVGGANGGLKLAQQQLRRRLLDAASPSPPVPPQRTMQSMAHGTSQPHHRTPPPPPRRTESPPMATGNHYPNGSNGVGDIDGPFVFGVHHPNTFTPAYGNKAATLYGANTASVTRNKDAKDPIHSSPDTSQNSSDISSSEKSRRALVKEKKNSKRAKKHDKKEKSKENRLRASDAKKPPPPNVKCVLVGDGAVGKTNLIVSYIQDRFIHEYVPTAFDKYNVDVSVDGRPICVTLCDTAGQDALDTLRQLCYPGSDVILLCFCVVKPESFRSLATKWEPEISKLKGVSVVLVGTQSDLRSDPGTMAQLQARGEKPIPVSSAWDFARKIGAKYVETSSHRKERIKEVFDTAIWDALQSQEYNKRKRPLWRRLCCLPC